MNMVLHLTLLLLCTFTYWNCSSSREKESSFLLWLSKTFGELRRGIIPLLINFMDPPPPRPPTEGIIWKDYCL